MRSALEGENSFYEKIKKECILDPIFHRNSSIAIPSELKHFLNVFINFWEGKLLVEQVAYFQITK